MAGIKYYFDKKKQVKKEIRLIGVDDAPFDKLKKGEIPIIGCIHRGGGLLEGIISDKITVDGEDSTKKIADMINRTKHKDQLQCIFTDGIAVGGFNVIDVKLLADKTHLPVIVIMRNHPNLESIKSAIKNVPNYKMKLKLIKQAGKIREIEVGGGKIYFQCKAIPVKKAKEIIKVAVTRGHMPEPIRTAHLIASGIAEGESKGRA
ncbi:DUF99 family protein [Candidatus Woesearchaeota archaeon]|nr:DUF99 family protein [Candidatus Woesearchaeota archaeon]MBW3018348.1 DUF99 family protein [Candidatus Woesearchaeota archaeon]